MKLTHLLGGSNEQTGQGKNKCIPYMSYSVTFSVLYIEVLESRVRDYYNGNMTTCIYSQLRTLLVHITQVILYHICLSACIMR